MSNQSNSTEEKQNPAADGPTDSAWKPMLILLVPFALMLLYGALT
jgi:hypothetical protein